MVTLVFRAGRGQVGTLAIDNYKHARERTNISS